MASKITTSTRIPSIRKQEMKKKKKNTNLAWLNATELVHEFSTSFTAKISLLFFVYKNEKVKSFTQ